jgi:hypothetical protein
LADSIGTTPKLSARLPRHLYYKRALTYRIVAKPQTQGNSGFVPCSQKTAFGE